MVSKTFLFSHQSSNVINDVKLFLKSVASYGVTNWLTNISRFEKLCRACVLCMLWYVSTLNKTLFIIFISLHGAKLDIYVVFAFPVFFTMDAPDEGYSRVVSC